MGNTGNHDPEKLRSSEFLSITEGVSSEVFHGRLVIKDEVIEGPFNLVFIGTHLQTFFDGATDRITGNMTVMIENEQLPVSVPEAIEHDKQSHPDHYDPNLATVVVIRPLTADGTTQNIKQLPQDQETIVTRKMQLMNGASFLKNVGMDENKTVLFTTLNYQRISAEGEMTQETIIIVPVSFITAD